MCKNKGEEIRGKKYRGEGRVFSILFVLLSRSENNEY